MLDKKKKLLLGIGIIFLAALASWPLWKSPSRAVAQSNPSTFYSAAPYAANMEFLGSASCPADCATIGPVTFPPRDVIIIIVKLVGYSGGDIVSMRFNNDSGANYWDRHLTSETATATFTNTQTVSTTLCRLAGIAVSTGRTIIATGSNKAALAKHFNIVTGDVTGAAGTAGRMDIGQCEWVNTSAQITDIRMVAAGGANLIADSAFGVFGKDF